jgi:hypothetical protein
VKEPQTPALRAQGGYAGEISSWPAQAGHQASLYRIASDSEDRFIRSHNQNAQPFVWTATADAILQKLARLCQRISGTEH